MKNVNVKVVMNNEGQVQVLGLNKDGSVSAVNYSVVETAGVREFAKAMMKAGVEKQASSVKPVKESAERSEAQPTKEETKMKQTVNRKGFDAVVTGGHQFTDIKPIKTNNVLRAVKFTVGGKECVVGFARDRNAFMEAYNGTIKEVTKYGVLKRLAKYEGKDAKHLTKMVKSLSPVTMASGHCANCGCEVSQRVKEYSVRVYGVTLCRDCQKDFGENYKESARQESESKKAPSESEAQGSSQENLLNLQYDTCECGNKKHVESNICHDCQKAIWDKEAEQAAEELDLPVDELPEAMQVIIDSEINKKPSEDGTSSTPTEIVTDDAAQTETEYQSSVVVEFDTSELV